MVIFGESQTSFLCFDSLITSEYYCTWLYVVASLGSVIPSHTHSTAYSTSARPKQDGAGTVGSSEDRPVLGDGIAIKTATRMPDGFPLTEPKEDISSDVFDSAEL